jgi:hypothetical protein
VIRIEVDGIAVEAETEKEARAQLRKLLREKKTKEREEGIRAEVARIKAESAAYRLLLRYVGDQDLPRAWHLIRPGEPSGVFQAGERSAMDGRVTTHLLEVEGSSERVVVEHHSHTLVGAVLSGGGYVWVLFLQDRSGPGVHAYTVASHQGVVRTAVLPDCITMALFEKKEAP